MKKPMTEEHKERLRQSLRESREKKKLAKENGEEIKQKNPKERWELDKKSLRKSIDAMCYECMGYQREEIKICSSPNCPLYLIRPYK